jgi:hypothetical protein
VTYRARQSLFCRRNQFDIRRRIPITHEPAVLFVQLNDLNRTAVLLGAAPPRSFAQAVAAAKIQQIQTARRHRLMHN